MLQTSQVWGTDRVFRGLQRSSKRRTQSMTAATQNSLETELDLSLDSVTCNKLGGNLPDLEAINPILVELCDIENYPVLVLQ